MRPPHDPPAETLNPAQRLRMQLRDADQDRTLQAIQDLEAALAAAAPRREQAWLGQVRHALAVLSQAACQEADEAAQPDSLLSDIARTQPWLRNRVRGLRVHYAQLRDGLAALQQELDGRNDQPDYTDIRHRLAWALTGLRYQRSRESDLIYEAYYDTYDIELAAEISPTS